MQNTGPILSINPTEILTLSENVSFKLSHIINELITQFAQILRHGPTLPKDRAKLDQSDIVTV